MVKSINLVRNVGQFENVSTGASLPFSQVTIVYAENGRGKTTLAAILRSLASGAAGPILERTRLGASHQPHVVIDIDGRQPAIFQNGAWSRTSPDIVVFDDNFVADNVCSGIEVAPSHRQNLHELIVGAQGVALNAAHQTQVDKIEMHNRELRLRGDAIPAHRRGAFDVESFCALAQIANLSQQIEDAERHLAAARDAHHIVQMDTLPKISLPTIDLGPLESIFVKGLSELDADALRLVQSHIGALGRDGERWVSEGMLMADQLAADGRTECPFCAQGLGGSSIINHYRSYFGEAYKNLKAEISAAADAFSVAHDGDVPVAFERTVREAVERQGFWKAFARIPDIQIDTSQIALQWKRAREEVQAAFAQKRSAPLEIIQIPDDVRRAVADHNDNCASLSRLSADFEQLNTELNIVKQQARSADVPSLEADLARLRAVEARYDPTVKPLCDAYMAEKAAKAATEVARTAARTALDGHRRTAFPQYGDAINDFLQRFNASFRVGPVDPVNIRGGSAANYTLLIDSNQVPLSGPDGNQSFKNTLSAGDRNTLALAFFFASLQHDPARAQKIVVIDDPMTSLDEHRTLHTLQEMDRLARDVAGMIVLSHSKSFLLGVWEQRQQLPKAALQVRRAAVGSTLAAWDVNGDMVTEHDRRYAAVVSYLSFADPQAERRVAEALRPMLEKFARVAYPADFPPGSMLGAFHNLCVQRQGTPNEIMSAANARELRALLDFANRYHHDTNPAYATERISDSELTDFARRTLAFIRRP